MTRNCIYIVMILLAVCLLSQINVVNAVITIPSREGPLPISSREITEKSFDQTKEVSDTVEPSNYPSKKTTGGYSEPPPTEYQTRNLEIKKSYYPIRSDGYMTNNVSEIPYVSVEIKCMNKIDSPIYIY